MDFLVAIWSLIESRFFVGFSLPLLTLELVETEYVARWLVDTTRGLENLLLENEIRSLNPAKLNTIVLGNLTSIEGFGESLGIARDSGCVWGSASAC